jgi:hypothetical protein
MAYENVGLVWTPSTLTEYVSKLEVPSWCKGITLHHTGAPSLAQRPKGFLMQHIENLRHFYRDELKWSAGPHLFIDEDEIFGMCDLRVKGVHAVSFNRKSIGIEVLGNYDSEDPLAGRGLGCWTTAAAAVRVLLDWLDLDPGEQTILFHRDDPTTKKSCPGTKVKKDWFLSLIDGSSIAETSAVEEKPDLGMAWDKWDYRGEKWCVPVFEFLTANNVPPSSVYASLKSQGGKFYYGSELLEGAYYVGATSGIRPNQCTWAPVQELLEIL